MGEFYRFYGSTSSDSTGECEELREFPHIQAYPWNETLHGNPMGYFPWDWTGWDKHTLVCPMEQHGTVPMSDFFHFKSSLLYFSLLFVSILYFVMRHRINK